jgi:hypothetical protein
MSGWCLRYIKFIAQCTSDKTAATNIILKYRLKHELYGLWKYICKVILNQSKFPLSACLMTDLRLQHFAVSRTYDCFDLTGVVIGIVKLDAAGCRNKHGFTIFRPIVPSAESVVKRSGGAATVQLQRNVFRYIDNSSCDLSRNRCRWHLLINTYQLLCLSDTRNGG